MNEVPDNIEDVFSDLGLHLLPQSEKDFKTTCSCPDWSNPSKHIAGVYYLVASQLDDDPFLLFQLRGLSKDVLKAELSQSPLGKILSQELTTQEVSIQPSISFYTGGIPPPRPPAGFNLLFCPEISGRVESCRELQWRGNLSPDRGN